MKTIMYVHGFASSPNSQTINELRKLFRFPDYEIIAPEVSHIANESINKLNSIIRNNSVDLIIGTSLGGFYALGCSISSIPIVVINPSLCPSNDLWRFIGYNLYFNKREDKEEGFWFKGEHLECFKKFDKDIKTSIETKKDNLYAILSTRDEVISNTSETFKSILPSSHIIFTDVIGHRLSKGFIQTELKTLVNKLLNNREQDEQK